MFKGLSVKVTDFSLKGKKNPYKKLPQITNQNILVHTCRFIACSSVQRLHQETYLQRADSNGIRFAETSNNPSL